MSKKRASDSSRELHTSEREDNYCKQERERVCVRSVTRCVRVFFFLNVVIDPWMMDGYIWMG